MLEGMIPSIGTVGDALDNALCETTIGLYKTECVRPGSPFRTSPIPRPSTTLDSRPESTPVTCKKVCMKTGMLQSVCGAPASAT